MTRSGTDTRGRSGATSTTVTRAAGRGDGGGSATRRSRAVHGGAFVGTWPLVRLALRRDRLRIPLWLLGIGGITAASGAAVSGVYPDQQAVDSYAALVASSPVTVAFGGPPVGLDTRAGIVVYETAFVCIIGVALLAVTMTSRHTRAEEESGRSEVVRAAVVGRHAGAAAALLVVGATCVLLGAVLAAVLAPTALSAGEAVLLGAGTAALGLWLSSATLCLAQVFSHSRTVTGAGLALVAVTYVVRAAGDVREDWLVWLSPVGWVQATHVSAENRWWPLLLPVLTALLLAALAVVLAGHRDFGGGLVAARSGRAEAGPSLSGTVGLAARVQRGAAVAWGSALLGFALLTGALGTSMQDMVEDNPTLAEYLEVAEGGSVLDSYIATMALILALVTASFGVWSASHRGADESAGQLELVLAGPVGRVRSRLGDLLITVLGTTAVLLVAAVGLGTAHGAVTGDPAEGWAAFTAQLTYLPAILVLIAVVVLLDGWLPRWTWAGWLLLAYSFLIGWLGGLLQPPAWMVEVSPFSHVPEVPLEPVQATPLVALTLVAAVLVGVGLIGLRRRDIG